MPAASLFEYHPIEPKNASKRFTAASSVFQPIAIYC